MKRHGYVMAAAFALLLIPLKAFSHGGDTNLVHACLKANGQTYIVGANTICSGSTDEPLHWASAGPKGDTGATGLQGLQGATGLAGPQGPVGSTGPQGVAGTDGTNGAPGADGPAGSTGPQGVVGETGATGAQGPIGDTGPAGANGQDGLAGATGPQGDTGLQGVVGETGPQGPKGDVGPRGFDGLAATETTPIIWSGGCSGYTNASGVYPNVGTFCLDIVEFNTAGGYLEVGSGGLVQIVTPGFYRVNFHGSTQFRGGWAGEIIKNGVAIHTAFSMNDHDNGNPYGDTIMDIMYPFNSGDLVTIQLQNVGGSGGDFHRYLCCFSSVGYTRLQVQYVGPLQ